MSNLINFKKILIFGVFDGIHEGHLFLIKEAKKKGIVVVIIARDEVVKKLKGNIPKYNEKERINSLLELEDIDQVFLGDKEQGSYRILKEINPDEILLGYDQQKIFESLHKAIKEGRILDTKIKFAESFKGEELHSSILNNPVKI
jgi:FAD synthetase